MARRFRPDLARSWPGWTRPIHVLASELKRWLDVSAMTVSPLSPCGSLWERVGVRGYGLSYRWTVTPHPDCICDAIRPLPQGERWYRARFANSPELLPASSVICPH